MMTLNEGPTESIIKKGTTHIEEVFHVITIKATRNEFHGVIFIVGKHVHVSPLFL